MIFVLFVTNLMMFIELIVLNLEDEKEVDCIYTDLSKAFDRVKINRLTYKLKIIGLQNPLPS